jgi:ABC-type uncharacterized transport system permease subunit
MGDQLVQELGFALKICGSSAELEELHGYQQNRERITSFLPGAKG